MDTRKQKTVMTDIVMSLLQQMDDWEPIGKQSIKVTFVSYDGGEVELFKDRKTFEEALKQTTERHRKALKKLADK